LGWLLDVQKASNVTWYCTFPGQPPIVGSNVAFAVSFEDESIVGFVIGFAVAVVVVFADGFVVNFAVVSVVGFVVAFVVGFEDGFVVDFAVGSVVGFAVAVFVGCVVTLLETVPLSVDITVFGVGVVSDLRTNPSVAIRLTVEYPKNELIELLGTVPVRRWIFSFGLVLSLADLNFSPLSVPAS
jgi:hypothetical protein